MYTGSWVEGTTLGYNLVYYRLFEIGIVMDA